MADITAQRINIQVEEVAGDSAVREGTFSRVGAAINMINENQHSEKIWELSGPYNAISGAQTGVAGAYICGRDFEIIGVGMYNLVAGSAGTLELDIIRHTSTGTSGSSIFSTTPKMVYSSGNNSYLYYDFSNSTAISSPSGSTQPVLVSANLNKGDMLSCNFVQKQTAGQSCGLVIHLRPR